MKCSPFDLKDYFLQELSAGEVQHVEAHVKTCAGCREELDRLRVTQSALLALRDEEVPQRIAFVSDKVFERSGWSRWWRSAWGPACVVPAAVLVVVLLVQSVAHPTTVQAPAPAVDVAAMQADLDRRLKDAVQKAVAESEARQQKKTAELLARQEHLNEIERRNLVLQVQESFEAMRKKLNVMILASNDYGARP